MKNLALVILAILILGGAGFFYYSSSQNKTTVGMPLPGGTQITEKSALSSDGKYIEYSKENLYKNKDKKRILYFYANWCPVCRPANENFIKNETRIPEGVVVIRVNYNDTDTDKEEEALATKYAITYQHTFVEIDSNGEAIKKWNGTESFEDFLNNL